MIPASKRLDRKLMLSPEDVASAVMQIVKSPMGACPLEVAVEPQRNPERAS